MPKPSAKSPERQKRLAAALRANLKRRKAQVRTLAQASGGTDRAGVPEKIDPAATASPDSGPIPAQKNG
ncbi:MAG: hypothetical protein KGL26_12875 [Pseudomonadota bacterium]|nr:hypothetical protein [Pseudomonadota bacterium]